MYEDSSSGDNRESARKVSMSVIPVKLREAIKKKKGQQNYRRIKEVLGF